jgi:hypothetical protein
VLLQQGTLALALSASLHTLSRNDLVLPSTRRSMKTSGRPHGDFVRRPALKIVQ